MTILSYLGGLIDGEGSFCIERTAPSGASKTMSYLATLSVEMTDVEPLRILHEKFGGYFKCRQRYKHWKPIHTWKVASRQAELVIKQILPYLKIKRKQKAAKACLGLLKVPSSHLGQGVRTPEHILRRRQYFYEQCRKANRRGSTSL